MFKLILILPIIFLSSFSFANTDHDHDHMKAPEIQLVTSDNQNKPTMMRSTSVKLLETQIGITGDHGQGRFFLEESTEVEKLVNQGFTMLNMFQWTDAFRSFNTALEINPKSVESYIGRAFASISIDPSQHYYLIITNNFLKINKDVLTKEQKAWANLLLSIMTRGDLDENPLATPKAYQSLLEDDPTNIEVSVFANWVSDTYNTSLLKKVLDIDSSNAGATHYLLHLGEGINDHDTALFYGEKLSKLTLGSGHGQHMYGHALPHFNRWNEADKQFSIAHDIHTKWAKTNNVHPSEDWHYTHNLDLWSVTKMVLEPSKAIQILEELEPYYDGYALDLLDLRIILGTDAKVESDIITSYEERSDYWKNFVISSRKLHTLINQPEEFDSNKNILFAGLDWENSTKDNTLYLSIILIESSVTGDKETQKRAVQYVTTYLADEFERGGFDGWRKSVLETLIYKKVFEVYGLNEALNAVNEKVINVYMNPVD